jgi:hypothetical protein
VSWGAEGVVSTELKVAVMMPPLEGKGETLVMKEFHVKLVLRWRWNEDQLEEVSALFFCIFLGWINDAFSFPVGHGTDLEQ